MSKKQMSKFAYSLLENYEVYGNTEDEEELGTRDDLINYIAELEAAQRWIPVGERLPEPNQSVLVFDRLGDMTIDFLVTFNREGVAYYTNSDDGAVCWMPLPEPPEVQE